MTIAGEQDESIIIDLCAGPGGWDEGAKLIDLPAPFGIEIDADACATRVAAGHQTLRADISRLDPLEVAAGRPVAGLIVSAPCKAFSRAGKGKANPLRAALTQAVHDGDWTVRPDPDPLVWLILEIGRWAEALRPRWIACEETPSVLPIFETYREVFERWGYSAWAGNVTAETYGVPQTRARSLLLASLDRTVGCPAPTHERFRKRKSEQPGLGMVKPFVTMAQALGWTEEMRAGFPRLDLQSAMHSHPNDGTQPRTLDEPAHTVAFGHSSPQWIEPEKVIARQPWRRNDQGIDGGASGGPDQLWPLERPATTIAGRELVPDPGANGNRFNGATKSRNDGYKITLEEALLLQSFRADYPLQGTKSSRARQVGDAVPPLLAAHALAMAAGVKPPE